ncbi:MAG: cell filamentation protein Fic [Clostridia bacterium]|nr:cell filamentation protein Fic [Clostridia bacterium]
MENSENFVPKYKMSLNENILWAKRNLIDSIWKSANLEGIAVTYPDTQVICEGMSVAGYTIDEINAVNDLKYAWQYLLENIEEPITLKFMKALHINGTDWCPELPNEQKIQDNLNGILKIDNPMDRALEIFLFCARGQFFYDGNKRLSTLITNKVMIENGIGVFSIPIKCHSEFYKLLIDFYETGSKTEIKKFLYDNCIDGVNMN